jgi:hypothetical protein
MRVSRFLSRYSHWIGERASLMARRPFPVYGSQRRIKTEHLTGDGDGVLVDHAGLV